MTLLDYQSLKQQVVIRVGNSDSHSYLINKLKEFYKDDIDSERRYEKICSIEDLLNILQVRNVLSEDNVAPIKEIARKLNDNELVENICMYESHHVPREYINYYAVKNPSVIKKNKPEAKLTFNSLFDNLSEKKKSLIKKTLVEEIGIYWRDLARNLKIRECKIDEIDSKYQTHNEKVEELFRIFKDNTDLQKWFFILCDALDKSRRKDLSKSLQDIITMNI